VPLVTSFHTVKYDEKGNDVITKEHAAKRKKQHL